MFFCFLTRLHYYYSLHSKPIAVPSSFGQLQHRFIWMPGHAGIPGNEFTDEMVRSTPATAPTFSLLTHSDLLIHLKNNLTGTWTRNFNSNISHTSAYYQIQLSIPSNPWFFDLPGFTRESIVAIRRLIRFGHDYLPATLARFIPNLSPYCPLHPHTRTLATSNHIFLECPNLLPSIERFENLSVSGAPRPWSVTSSLTTKDPLIYHAFAQFLSQLTTPIQI